ncbi:MAG: TerC family protein [Gemmatimonadaceae bacterium]|nr:TerC family protein [Acetobacteraceae bacterium]
MEFLLDPQVWISLLTLTALEIVLGIDNIIFVAILAGKLPAHQQDRARQIGLALALLMRLGLLASLSWLVGLTATVFTAFGQPFSWRDLVLIFGGLFLAYKGTTEIHQRMEPTADEAPGVGKAAAGFGAVIVQIILLDAVFSLDSVITAVGMVDELWIMSTAVVAAAVMMLVASGPLSRFVQKHPTVKMLAISFLLMIAMVLIADGFGVHIPKGYVYAAMGFSVLVETLNLIAAGRRKGRAPG